jgi:RHS repeat-associated protein
VDSGCRPTATANQNSLASRSCLPANHPVSHYHRNQQYSITALTNGSGTITERYAYTAYGTPTITDASGTELTSSADNNRYTYTGREWDSQMRLYHYRARMYDSVAGRFCSRDPIGYAGSKCNLTEYVSGHPLTRTDPSGLKFAGQPQCCKPRAEAQCCDDAVADGIDEGHMGGVVCCDGRPVTCAWSKNVKILTSPLGKKVILECVLEHEKVHVPDIFNCKSAPCRQLVRGRITWWWKNRMECKAYEVEKLCLTYAKTTKW